MKPTGSPEYYRGLVGAKLAGGDYWTFVVAGSKDFVASGHAITRSVDLGEKVLIIAPHSVEVRTPAGEPCPDFWFALTLLPKPSDPLARLDLLRIFRALLALIGPVPPWSDKQDIVILIDPIAPEYAKNVVTNYMLWIKDGKGSWPAPR